MIRTAILAAILAAALIPTPAHAATGFLVSCTTGTSITGAFVYVGTYDYLGRRFTLTFSEYCPATVDIR